MNIFKWLLSSKYRFFSKKMSDLDKSVMELEFKVYKAREMREDSRQHRDRSLENLKRIDVAIEGEKDPKKTAEYQADREKHAANVVAYEKQMAMVDRQIQGAPYVAPTKDTPGDEGQQGFLEVLAGLAQLKNMYEDYRSR